MNISQNVVRIIDESLGLNGRSATFSMETPLLGALPELDSMTVIHLITELESQLGLDIEDEDLNSDLFSTVGSLVLFVTSKFSSSEQVK